jgi:hypothetical protein
MRRFVTAFAQLMGVVLCLFIASGCGGGAKPTSAASALVNAPAYRTHPPALGGSRPSATSTPAPPPGH